MIFFQVSIEHYRFPEEVDWDGLRMAWPEDLPEERPDHLYSIFSHPQRMTAGEVQQLITVLGKEGAKSLVLEPSETNTMFVKTQDTDRRWSYGESPMPDDFYKAQAVQITIPDMALLMLNKVTNLDNACTDELQQHLEDGWRILAVCPPNAQRRPDYILGRRE